MVYTQHLKCCPLLWMWVRLPLGPPARLRTASARQCEISLVVELVLPKDRAPVRFRHLAPNKKLTFTLFYDKNLLDKEVP